MRFAYDAHCSGRTRLLILFFALAGVLVDGCGTIKGEAELYHARRAFHQQIHFKGANGPVSNAEGRQILADLQASSGKSDILQRHLAFEQAITGSPLIVGNKVTLLEDGAAAYRAMFNAIEGAEESINLETYQFFADSIGEEFADALIAKQRAGVQVNVIYDSFGCLGVPQQFFDRMRESGIRVLQFNPVSPLKRRLPWAATNRDHRKMLIVDGRIAIMGGINISDVYSSSLGSRSSWPGKPAARDLGSWRDTDIQIEGPAVTECQKLFIEHWIDQNAAPLPPRRYFVPLENQGDDILRIIGFAPGQSSEIYVTMISAINNAEKNVYITDAYFAPDRQMLKAMRAAAARGVDVRLLLPGTTAEFLIGSAARSHYAELMKSGVKIYEWRGKMLHAKTATIDDVWSTVGSSNLDWWSIARNDEVSATILGSPFGDQMEKMFARDLQNSKHIDPEQWRSRPIFERLKEFFAGLIEPAL